MGLVSRLSLANHSDSECFLVVHALFSQEGCQREGFWEVVGQVVSPFDLSWALPVGGGLLVPCSLPEPPVVTWLMKMITMVSGQDGQFQSVCFPQHTHVTCFYYHIPLVLICIPVSTVHSELRLCVSIIYESPQLLWKVLVDIGHVVVFPLVNACMRSLLYAYWMNELYMH